MKINIKKIGIGIGAAFILIGGTYSFSEPGSESDPLVTFSYVEKKLDEMKRDIKEYVADYVNEELADDETENEKQGAWEIVNVVGGETLIGEGGTEIILRTGKCSAITNISKSPNGNIIDNGLADITDGKDLKMGANIPSDHMLLIPRGDGRGVNCISDSIFMVNGDYRVSR